MLSPEAVTALTRELAAINRQLAEFDTLREKKADIEGLLHKWGKMPASAAADRRPEPLVPLASLLDRLEPEPSKAKSIAQAARAYLESTPDGEAPFIEIYNAIPTHVFGDNMKHPREYTRTVLSRKGGEYGIVYEDADHVRLAATRTIIAPDDSVAARILRSAGIPIRPEVVTPGR